MPYTVYVCKATKWCCANSSSLITSIYMLGMPHIRHVYHFWLAGYRKSAVSLSDRQSECFARMHIPMSKQLHSYVGVSEVAELIHYNDRNSCESVLSVWSSEAHHYLGFCRQYPVLRTNLDDRDCKCHAGWWVNWAASSQLYLISRNIMQVIIITRLHVMYQQSRKILIFLVAIFLVITGTCGVIAAIGSKYTMGRKFESWLECARLIRWIPEELILSGSHQCSYNYEGVSGLLDALAWVCYTLWEVLTLCLAIRIAIQHFRALRCSSTGWTIRDSLTVMIQTHVVYFARWARSFNAVVSWR